MYILLVIDYSKKKKKKKVYMQTEHMTEFPKLFLPEDIFRNKEEGL